MIIRLIVTLDCARCTRVYKYRVIYRCENWTTGYSLLIARLPLSQKINWLIVVLVHWQEKWFHYINIRRKCIFWCRERFFRFKEMFLCYTIKEKISLNVISLNIILFNQTNSFILFKKIMFKSKKWCSKKFFL